jgi:hypothetical protein
MNIRELYNRLGVLIGSGQGEKSIYIEGIYDNLQIDSVQKDTMPKVEANYYFIMSGGKVK